MAAGGILSFFGVLVAGRGWRDKRIVVGIASIGVVVLVVTGIILLTLSSMPAGPGPLTVFLSMTPDNGSAPLDTIFNITATGGAPPYSYFIQFGDGSEENNTTASGSHTYESAGDYVAEVEVNDSDNNTAWAVVAVNVHGISPTNNSTSPIALYANDPGSERVMISESGYLRPGDFCYLASGNGNSGVDVGKLNTWARQVHAAEPECTLVAMTAKLRNIETMLGLDCGDSCGGLSSLYSWVALEITPSSLNSSSENLSYSELQQGAADIRSAGLFPATYVTGMQILSGLLNYSALGSLVSHETIETQRHCVPSADIDCLGRIAGEFNETGQPLSKLSFQATIGVDNESSILTTYHESVFLRCGYYLFEFNGGDSETLAALLQLMGR